MDPNELDLVPVAELKAALLRRFDHVIVAAFVPAEDGAVEDVSWGWRGDAYRVIGLMEELKIRMFTPREAERS
jgi:hypothetical protein